MVIKPDEIKFILFESSLSEPNPFRDKIRLGYDIYYFWTRGKFDIEKYKTLEGVAP